MMSPNEKAKDSNRQTRERDKLVAENVLARKVCDQLAYHPHRRQDHDVNSRMRIEPEEVLKKHRISPQCRIKDAHMGQTLKREQQNSDGNHRRAEDHYQAC